MLIASSRLQFNDPDQLKEEGHAFRDIDLQTDAAVADLTEEEFLNAVESKSVLLLVHGYNNEQDEVYDAYSVIEQKAMEHVDAHYDMVLGYSWPGGDHGIEWYQSKRRANAVARRFRFLMERMSDRSAGLDIMSHSLGARVTLKALKQSPKDDVVRNYFCTAPAVDDECLEAGEEFHPSVEKCQSLFVFHSKRDGVLSTAYRVAEFDNALGLYGPEDKAYIQNRTKNIFVANCKKKVRSHGGYKRCDAMYRYMASSFGKKPVKFKTL